MAEPFCLLLRVRYAECDAQQVVFNARYGDYLDVAATEYFRHVLGDYSQMIKDGVDNHIVRMVTDWQSPARFDDVLAIRVKPGHLGNTSYGIDVDVSDHATGRQVARIQAVYVMVDSVHYEKMVIPDRYREALERGAPGVVVNQAGP